MIKPVSTLSIIVAGVMCIVPTFGAQMTPQIQRLLDQKQEKIKKLEECEGKKQGWMIAGISTIGVTAVGVGLNIAQASKRNRLDDEIDTARHDLEVQERHLGEINSQIADRERENAKLECSQQEGMVWKNGQCVPVVSGEKASDDGIATAPKLDTEPDGKIGEPCGTDNKGKWTEKTDGPNTCSNANGLVQCECAVETNVTPGGGEKSDKSGDGKKAFGKTGGGEKFDKPGDDEKASGKTGGGEKSDKSGDGKKASGKTGGSEKSDKPGDDKPVACEEGYVRILRGDGKCVKVDYLQGAKCACKDGTNDCSLIDDNNGQFICQSSKGWGYRCSCQECQDGRSFDRSSGKCESRVTEDILERAKKHPDITCCDTADVYKNYAGTWVFSGTQYANSRCQCIFEYKKVDAGNAKNLIDEWGKANGESRFTCSSTDHNGRRSAQGQQARQCYGADSDAFYEFIFKK